LRPLLVDEGLPHQVAEALSVLGWPAHAVGHPGAPVRNSSDETNCQWCKEHDNAVLVTNDLGRKDKTIFDHIAAHQVDVIFVRNDLRFAPAHALARALLRSEEEMDRLSASRHAIRHRLKPTGRLEKR
jgi:Domain of unknown function (DUF5615)